MLEQYRKLISLYQNEFVELLTVILSCIHTEGQITDQNLMLSKVFYFDLFYISTEL